MLNVNHCIVAAVVHACHQRPLLHQQKISSHSDTFTCRYLNWCSHAKFSVLWHLHAHKLTWGHSCSALWIWGSAWQGDRLPARTAPVWFLRWNWTCQTWPGRTVGVSWCCFHHLGEQKRRGLINLQWNEMKAGAFFLWKLWLNCIREHFYSALTGIINVWRK